MWTDDAKVAEERFWSESVQRRIRHDDAAGCWTWTGGKNQFGYGVVHVAGKHTLVHRLAYEANGALISPQLTIDHLCCNKACCNPFHLELVTLAENIRRANWLTETCRSGRHPVSAMRVRPSGERICAPCEAEGIRARNASRPTTRAGRAARAAANAARKAVANVG